MPKWEVTLTHGEWRDVLRHHSARGHRAALADRHAWENDGAAPNPDIVPWRGHTRWQGAAIGR